MTSTAPLDGVIVLDLTQVVSGPVATMLLADFGAQVIKVEPPGGEPYRRFGRKVEGPGGTANLNALRWNRGKKSIVLDLKTEVGLRHLRTLITKADVLVENFRPGVLDKLGFDAETLRDLNPALIYGSISGFGHAARGARSGEELPAYAIVAEAMAGLTYLARGRSGEPVWLGFAMSDVLAGVLAFAGVLLALRERDRGVEAPRVDVAMHDGALFMNDMALILDSVFHEQKDPRGHSLQAPWGIYPASDGHVVVAVMDLRQWHALCRILGRADWAADRRLDSGSYRSSVGAEVIDPVLEAYTTRRQRAQVVQALLAAGIACGPVRTTAEAANSHETGSRGMLVTARNRSVGEVRVVGNPIKLSSASGRLALDIPDLDEHGDEIRRAFGLEDG